MLKKSVMKRHILLIFTILYFTINGYSQACGSGILTLNIYTINGKKIKEASYEIFQASEELTERYKFPDSYGSGKMIYDFKENDITKIEDSTKLNKLLERSSIFRKGSFTSTMEFKTTENGYFPIILKISIKDQTIYILGNYFGGCDREACLIWNGTYFRLI